MGKSNRLLAGCALCLLTLFSTTLLALMNVRPAAAQGEQPPKDLSNTEMLVAHFADGPYGVTSAHEYQGLVTVTVTGIGQASATQYNDAFYILTDNQGNPITPYHPTEFYNWVLSINGQHAETFIPGNVVPPYQNDNSYTFQIEAPGGSLTFGVNDVGTFDNTGSYIITINPQTACELPYFSQLDPAWRNHPLRTAGRCDPSCSTIGACGCTLTVGAMYLAYLGANTNPPALSDCMGVNACPFSGSAAAACSNGAATGYRLQGWSWEFLERELNENNHPVILGMFRDDNDNGQWDTNERHTHFVLVLHGHGRDFGNYIVHDPGTLNGANTSLDAYTTRLNYVPYRLAVFDGQPTCTLARPAVESVNSIPTEPAIITPQPTQPQSPLAIGGSITRYHLNLTTVVVQLEASSTEGAITEMLVWSDSSPTPQWRPFETLAWLPWDSGDLLYARFRDETGAESETFMETLTPATSPPPPEALYLPMILRETE